MDLSMRSSDVKKVLSGEIYREEPMFVHKLKLQKGQFVIGRMLALCRIDKDKVTVRRNKEEASLVVARELCDDWIRKNVYPADERTVASYIQKDYETFRDLRKTENRTETWFSKVEEFN
ncbi:hypothetical protein SNE40_001126 [Patella caerulea]|uniref:Uncharacterized protein n=1 Tax=Patella caerulea TaxID=87958 RepID=A0AAN8KDU3_PATCE